MTETRKRPSRAEQEAAAEEEAAKAAASSGGVQVSWTQFGDRVITKKDFAAVNVEHDTVEWSKSNRYTAVVSQEAAEYLLAEEQGFALTSSLRKAKLKEMGVELEPSGPTGPGGGGGEAAPSPSSTGSTSTSTV